MFSMTYVSSATAPLSTADIEQILNASRHNNEQAGITGILLYADGNIIQVLEGDEAVVRERYKLIEQDARHHGAIVLLEENINERAFPEWTMGFKQVDREDLMAATGANQQLTASAQPLNLNRNTVQILLNNFKNMVS